jgi:4-diphosphocytidyl-2-C-methyl-D-erythritol kinase
MIVSSYPWGFGGRAPAKLNLTLHLLSKRNDGYHEIETLMAPVNLYDTLYFRPNRSGQVDFSYSWPQDRGATCGEELPRDATNLVVRALEAVKSRTDSRAGAVVHLAKRIPTQAGMGGGSSDAACALVLANRAWRVGLADEELAEMAAEIGSDVPFFLANRAAICRGRGERVAPVSVCAGLHVVVVKPPVGLSTRQIYGAVTISGSELKSERLATCLANGTGRKSLTELLNNDLEKPAAAQSPWIETMRRDMADCGCVASQMTGSGSAYFGICHHRRHAQAVAGRMRSKGYEQVFQLQSCRH